MQLTTTSTSTLITGLLLHLLCLQDVSSFAFITQQPPKPKQQQRFRFLVARVVSMTMTAADDDSSYEPYFQMQQIPTATTGAKLDRIVHCADAGGGMCNVEEMMEMMEGE